MENIFKDFSIFSSLSSDVILDCLVINFFVLIFPKESIVQNFVNIVLEITVFCFGSLLCVELMQLAIHGKCLN